MEAEARDKAISEQVEGCDLCGTEMFKSQAVRAAHLQTKGHLQAVEREERREQRRMGHSVRGRTCKAKGARVDSGADRPVEDFSAVGSDGVARPVFHRVGRAFPKRQAQTPSIAPSAAASEAFPGLVDASLQRSSSRRSSAAHRTILRTRMHLSRALQHQRHPLWDPRTLSSIPH